MKNNNIATSFYIFLGTVLMLNVINAFHKENWEAVFGWLTAIVWFAIHVRDSNKKKD